MKKKDIILSDEQQLFIDKAKEGKIFLLMRVSAAEKQQLYKNCVAIFLKALIFFILHIINY